MRAKEKREKKKEFFLRGCGRGGPTIALSYPFSGVKREGKKEEKNSKGIDASLTTRRTERKGRRKREEREKRGNVPLGRITSSPSPALLERGGREP